MKRLDIEWRHLLKGGRTCERCSDTGEAVDAAYRALAAELEPRGWCVTLRETPLTEEDIAESNTILLNGQPLELLLPGAHSASNCCASCGDLLGMPAMCRTIVHGGRMYEAIPRALIIEAAHRIVQQTLAD